jgi:hypothetical protein
MKPTARPRFRDLGLLNPRDRDSQNPDDGHPNPAPNTSAPELNIAVGCAVVQGSERSKVPLTWGAKPRVKPGEP